MNTRHGRGRVMALVVCLLLVVAGKLPGQDPAEQPPRLTLEEAKERAMLHNPGYRQSVNNLDLNIYGERSAWLGLLPRPSLNLLRTGRTWQRTTVTTDFFGEPLENPQTQITRTSRSSQTAGLSMSFDLRQYLALQRERANSANREVTAHAAGRELRSEVVGSFLDVHEAKLGLELAERNLEAAKLNKERARRLFAQGRAANIDLLGAEADVAEREVGVEGAQARLRETVLALRHLIGDPDLPEFQIEPVPLNLFDPEVLDEDALVDRGLAHNPQVLSQQANLEAQLRSRTTTRAAWLPTMALTVSTGRQRIERGGDAFLDPLPGGHWNPNVSLSLNFPDLGQYLDRNNQLAMNDVAIRNQRQQERQVAAEVERRIRSAVNGLRSAYRGVALRERRAEIAQERVRLVRSEFVAAKQDFFQLQAAENQAAEARRQVLESRFAFERARLRLESAIGGPLDVPATAVGTVPDGR